MIKKRPLVGICFISVKWKVSITKRRFSIENLFLKTLPLSSRAILKETMTSSPPRELRASRNNPAIHFNLKNKRSHHEPTYHDHRYYSLPTLPKLHTITGQLLEIVTIKRQGVSSRASSFSKVTNQVSGIVIIWLPNQGIVL